MFGMGNWLIRRPETQEEDSTVCFSGSDILCHLSRAPARGADPSSRKQDVVACGETPAAKPLSSLVRMPEFQPGSEQAILRGRGFRGGSPLHQNSHCVAISGRGRRHAQEECHVPKPAEGRAVIAQGEGPTTTQGRRERVARRASPGSGHRSGQPRAPGPAARRWRGARSPT